MKKTTRPAAGGKERATRKNGAGARATKASDLGRSDRDGVRRARGRPRSDEARTAVLEATRGLLERAGYGALTMELIAREAGVGKMTLYRWWRSKADIALELLDEGARARIPAPDSGGLEADLRAFVAGGLEFLQSGMAPVLRALMAEAQSTPAFAAEFSERFLAERRAGLRELLERGRRRGELAAGTDLDFLVDLIYGAMWHRLQLGHARIDRAFAAGIVDLVLRYRG